MFGKSAGVEAVVVRPAHCTEQAAAEVGAGAGAEEERRHPSGIEAGRREYSRTMAGYAPAETAAYWNPAGSPAEMSPGLYLRAGATRQHELGAVADRHTSLVQFLLRALTGSGGGVLICG